MDGEQRRAQIIKMLESGSEPLSGTVLAKSLQVSRQVIVQDIALLRANNKNILSTNRGYVIFGESHKHMCKRVLAVKHDDGQMCGELYAIVDAGARVLDVIVEHEVYGQIAADLSIASRRDVDEFMEKIFKDGARPLKELTGDVHYHTIEADSEEILDAAEMNLQKLGCLIFS